ncbi:MAG TPA: DUF4142 domain-containing protein [Hanamia sp.]
MKSQAKILMLAITVSFFLFSCSKKTNNDETITTQDRIFMAQASAGNIAEIQTAKLADSITDSSAIQSFAHLVITDHNYAQNDLKTLGNNIRLPVKDSVDANDDSMRDSLKTMTGRVFDSVYVTRQIAVYQVAIAAFKQEINTGNRTEVVSYAAKYLPTLKQHLQKAESIAQAMHYQ